MAMSVDAAWQHQPSGSVDHPGAAVEPVGERSDPAAAHADVAAKPVGGGHDRTAANDQIEGGHVINPSPRRAQNVMRCSTPANSAYIAMPNAATTNRPANTSGVSKFAVAAIIR